MVRDDLLKNHFEGGFPLARGDGPRINKMSDFVESFSPRPWG